MSTNPTLALNGEGIPLKNMRVTVSMAFQDKDQSGQTSSTAKAEQGIKGKELRISGEIGFSDIALLKRILSWRLQLMPVASGRNTAWRMRWRAR